MAPDDFPRFRAVLAGMAELYQRELSPTLLDAYWLALRDWSLDDFEAGAGHLIATAKFLPRPADWNELRKAAMPTGGEAWNAAIAACLGWRYGTASVDPLTDRVVAMLGGYQHLALEPLDTQHFTRNKFLELYDELADVEFSRESVPQLAGPSQLAIGDGRVERPRLAGSWKSLGWQPPEKSGGKVPEGNPA